MNTWPTPPAAVPINGCSLAIQADTSAQLFGMVQLLLTCEHDHNFLIARDGKKLYCSELAMRCMADSDYADRHGMQEMRELEEEQLVDIRPRLSSEVQALAEQYRTARMQGEPAQSVVMLADDLATAVLNAA